MIYIPAALSFFCGDLLLAIGQETWIWCMAGIFASLPIPFINAGQNVILYQQIPDEMRGRVFSARNAAQEAVWLPCSCSQDFSAGCSAQSSPKEKKLACCSKMFYSKRNCFACGTSERMPVRADRRADGGFSGQNWLRHQLYRVAWILRCYLMTDFCDRNRRKIVF